MSAKMPLNNDEKRFRQVTDVFLPVCVSVFASVLSSERAISQILDVFLNMLLPYKVCMDNSSVCCLMLLLSSFFSPFVLFICVLNRVFERKNSVEKWLNYSSDEALNGRQTQNRKNHTHSE